MPAISLLELRTAILGAILTLCILGLGRLLRRALARQSPSTLPPEALSLRAEAARVEGELRVLTTEVEGRLDAKMDRLEALLKQSQALDKAPRPTEVARRTSATSARWDPLNSVNNADRNRVLELANLGELPEAIAGSVGLLRGEVDLILRLHRSSTERLQDS